MSEATPEGRPRCEVTEAAASRAVAAPGWYAWYRQWDSYEGEQSYASSLGADFTGDEADYSAGSTPAAQVARFSRASFLLEAGPRL